MTQAIHVKVGSWGRAWAVQIMTEAGFPVDLTNSSNARFSMGPLGGGARTIDDQPAIIASGSFTLPDGSVQMFAATDGVLIYQPTPADTAASGTYEGQFSYSTPSGPVIEPGSGYVTIIVQAVR